MATGFTLNSSQLPSWHAYYNDGNNYDLDDLTYALSTKQNYSTGFKVGTEDTGNWRIVQDNLIDDLKNDTYKLNHYAKDGHRCFILREALPPISTYRYKQILYGHYLKLQLDGNYLNIADVDSNAQKEVSTSISLSHRSKRVYFELIARGGLGGTNYSADNVTYYGSGGGGGASCCGILDFLVSDCYIVTIDANCVGLYSNNDSNKRIYCNHGKNGLDRDYSLPQIAFPGGDGGSIDASGKPDGVIVLGEYPGTAGGVGGIYALRQDGKYYVEKEGSKGTTRPLVNIPFTKLYGNGPRIYREAFKATEQINGAHATGGLSISTAFGRGGASGYSSVIGDMHAALYIYY